MILNGKIVAANIRQQLKEKVDKHVAEGLRAPCLVIFSVGDDPASKVYVRNKIKAGEEIGIEVKHIALPEDAFEPRLISTINYYNALPWVDGIMVQLPLPEGFNERKIIDAIDPDKDVDGLTTINVGRLRSGQNCLLPCTAKGVMDILRYYDIPVCGADVAIVGRSNIVGKPLADLMMAAGATVTQCHSKTHNLGYHLTGQDIVVSAVGKPKFITSGMISHGTVVIDVGINRDEKGKLCGDVNFDAVVDVAEAITPVPGGVGPMTVAELMANVIQAWELNIKGSA